MAVDSKGVSVQEHAAKVRDELIAAGKIQPDDKSHLGDKALPAFSAGTATLDAKTGKPVVKVTKPGPFADGKVALEGDRSADAVAGDRGNPDPPAPTKADAAPTPTATDLAADAAAQAMVDAFADAADFEFEDPDLNVKYPIRVPKAYLESAKRGYGRRAALDRTMSFYKNADPVVRALIEDGRMQQILPLLQRAFDDPEYGEYVYQGYEKRKKGESLLQAAAREAAAAAPPALNPGDEELLNDPILGPRFKQMQQLQERLDRFEAERVEQAQAAQRREEQQRQVATQMIAAHHDLATAYPGRYNPGMGPSDPRWQEVVKYANDSGYAQVYGLRAGIVFAAQAIAQIEQEREAISASPTATTLQQVEARQLALARQEAAAGASAVGTGGRGPDPGPRTYQRPERMRQDGTLKPVEEYMSEVQQALEASRA
jgi:hypothetical protein